MDRDAQLFYTTIAAFIRFWNVGYRSPNSEPPSHRNTLTTAAALRIVSTDGYLLMANRWNQIGYLMCELEYDLRTAASGSHRGSAGRTDRPSRESAIRTIWKLALTYQAGWS